MVCEKLNFFLGVVFYAAPCIFFQHFMLIDCRVDAAGN